MFKNKNSAYNKPINAVDLNAKGFYYIDCGIKTKEMDSMYILFQSGQAEFQSGLTSLEGKHEEYVCVENYDNMEEVCKKMQLPYHILTEARHFTYAKYDSYEGHDCASLEMLDFENILIHRGSVVIYLEKERAFFFTSQYELVCDILSTCVELSGDKASISRLIVLFFDAQTKEDDIAFDTLDKEILELEQAIITSQHRNCVADIISLRKRLMILKRYYDQLMDAIDMIAENENGIFDGKTLRSFKTLSRRTERRFQSALDLNESVTQVRESYEAEVDISLNTTMKVFTVMTTIFFPLTVIVGWYGMNLNMPEYGWRYGYLLIIGLSILVIVTSILFFKKKKWF